jgi:WD40 repeat protein
VVRSSPYEYKLYDSTGTEVETISGSERKNANTTLMEVSPDGKRILFLENEIFETPDGFNALRSSFTVVELDTRRRWIPLLPNRAPPSSVRFSPDGGYILATGLNTARLFDSAENILWNWLRPEDPNAFLGGGQFGGGGGPGGGFGGPGGGGFGGGQGPPGGGFGGGGGRGGLSRFTSRFSPDGRTLVYKDTSGTYALNTSTLKSVKMGTTINSLLDLGPKGQFLLARTADRRAVFDTSTGLMVSQLPPEANLGLAAFSPDGQRILYTDEGTAVRVFDASTGLHAIPSCGAGGVHAGWQPCAHADGNRSAGLAPGARRCLSPLPGEKY